MADAMKAPVGAALKRLRFDDLEGFAADDHRESWGAFLRSCEAIENALPQQRKGVDPDEAQIDIARSALKLGVNASPEQIHAFYESAFVPFLILPEEAKDREHPAFFTAYYRPEVAASRERTPQFSEPLLSRPDDLVTLPLGEDVPGLSGYAAARRRSNGDLEPYPARPQIEAGELGARAQPVAFVRDAIEAFMIHVQGSARLRFPDGSKADLTYAGRNGRPYTSIGKILIADGEISLQDMSLDRLKGWVRANGQNPGERGRALLQRNESFVFFSLSAVEDENQEPTAAANVPLTRMRSIAVDRSLWPYGLPFWIEAELPWQDGAMNRFRRMVIAQDTGSAILGPARADLYFGTGDEAGQLAGNIRHNGRMIVLLPKSAVP